MEHEHRPVFGTQATERSIDCIAIGNRARLIGECYDPTCCHIADGPVTLTARLAIDASDEDAMEPGLERIGVPEPAKVPPGANERFLDGVLREVTIPKHELGDVEEPVDRHGGEVGKRGPVPGARPLNQLSSHPSRPRPPAQFAPS